MRRLKKSELAEALHSANRTIPEIAHALKCTTDQVLQMLSLPIISTQKYAVTDFDKMFNCFNSIEGLIFVERESEHGYKYLFLTNEENLLRFRTCDLLELIKTQDFFEFDPEGKLASY